MSQAMCSFSGIWCWPLSKTIRPNGIIMVEFYAYSQEIVPGLQSKYPIYLKAGDEKVKLEILETCTGEFRLTQLILKPEKKLTPGLNYELVIDSLSTTHLQFLNMSKKYRDASFSWTAIMEEDLAAPVFSSQPQYVSKSYEQYGCGPAKFIHYKLQTKDVSELLVKTSVKSLLTGKTTSYYLLPEDGKLQIGHGMCSGAFVFKDNEKYEAVFSLIDASGNASSHVTEAYAFTSPSPDNS